MRWSWSYVLIVAPVALLVLAAVAGSVATVADLWALALMGGGAVLLCLVAERVADGDEARFLQAVILGGAVLKALLSLAQHKVLPLLVAEDAVFSLETAMQNIRMWDAGLWSPALPQTLAEAHYETLRLVTTILLRVFGPSSLVPEVVPVTATSSICIAIYLAGRALGATRSATRTAVLLSAFLPSIIYFSSQNVKDPITATATAWIIALMLRPPRGRSARTAAWIAGLILANLVATLYRPYVGILLIVGQGLAGAWSVRLPASPLGRVLRVWLLAAMFPLSVFLGLQERALAYGEALDIAWVTGRYERFRETAIEAGTKGSEYVIPVSASDPMTAVLQLPIRIPLLLLSPIPLFPGTLRRLMAYPEMWFIYLFCVPRFIVGLREVLRRNSPGALVVLLSVAPMIIAYALKTALSGEAIRVRTQFLPELLLFVGVGHALLRARREAPVMARPNKGQRKTHVGRAP